MNRRDVFGLAAAAAAWAVGFGTFSLFLHRVFRTSALDLALHNQLLWNLARGRYMMTSLVPDHFGAHHFWPGFALLVPFHAWGGTSAVLLAQAAWLAAGVCWAFRLALAITGSRRWAWAFSAVYLGQPTLVACVLFDYHPELFAIPPLLAALLAAQQRRWPAFFLWAALALSFYEVVGVVLLGLGIGMALSPPHRKAGLGLLAGLALYAVLVFGFVMPAFRTGPPVQHWERYQHLGPDLPSAAWNMIRHPWQAIQACVTWPKVRNLIYLSASTGFLCWRRPRFLLPALPLLALLWISRYSLQSDIRFEYVAPIVPFFLWAAMHGAAAFGPDAAEGRAPALLALAALLIAVHFTWRIPIRKDPFTLRHNLKELREALAMIPPEAAVSTDNPAGAHLGERDILVLFPELSKGTNRVDYVLLDFSDLHNKPDRYGREGGRLLLDRNFQRLYSSNGVAVFRRLDASR